MVMVVLEKGRAAGNHERGWRALHFPVLWMDEWAVATPVISSFNKIGDGGRYSALLCFSCSTMSWRSRGGSCSSRHQKLSERRPGCWGGENDKFLLSSNLPNCSITSINSRRRCRIEGNARVCGYGVSLLSITVITVLG